MARLLGEAFVTVSPDTKAFRQKAAAEIRKALGGLRFDVSIGLDTGRLRAQAREAVAKTQAGIGNVDVKITADTKALNAVMAKERAIAAARAADMKTQSAAQSKAARDYVSWWTKALNERDARDSKRFNTEQKRTQLIKAAQDKAWASYGKNLLATEKGEAGRATAREAQERTIKAAQDKAWASYGKNLLATEKLESGRATAREAQERAIKAAQDKAWASYGKNLLATEKLDKQVTTNSTVRWRGWVNLLLDVARKDIPLFGGAFQHVLPRILSTTNGLHLAADAAIEIVATWIPAAVALGIFGAAAVKSALQVERNVKNMGISTQATGQHFAVMGKIGSGVLSELAKPYVFQTFGLGLIAMQKNSSQTGTVVQEMGKTITKWAAEATSAFLGSTGKMALEGAKDFKLIGNSFHSLGSAFNVVLKSVPGYATMLLSFGATALQAFALVVKALQPLIAAFLAFHGAFLYIGTAVTVLKFGLGQLVRPFLQIRNLLRDTSGAAETSVGSWKKTTKAIRDAGQEMQGSFTRGAGAVKTALNDLPAGASNTTRAFTALKTGGAAALSAVGSAAVKAGSTVKSGFLRVLGNLGINPWVAGLTAAGFGIGLLVQHFILAKDAAQQFGAEADKALSTSTVRNFGDVVTTQLSAAKAAYAASANAAADYAKQINVTHVAASYQVRDAANVANGQAGQAVHLQKLTQLQQDYGAVITDLQGKQDRFGQHLGTLGRSLGGTSSAMELVERSGVSMDDFVSKDTKTWLQAQLQVEATARGYQAMTAQVGGLGTALNALNVQDSQQLKSATDLEGAYTNFLGIITGGISNLGTFSQGMMTLGQNIGLGSKAASFGNITLGKLKGSLAAAHVSLDGTSTASMAAAQAFSTQVTNAGALYNSLLSLATVSGNGASAQHALAQAGKDMVAQLLPLASTSKTATTEVYALAQIAGYTGDNSLRGLKGWLGKTTGSMGDLHHQTDLLTQSAGNLAADAKTLANDLSTGLNQALAQSIIAAYGGQRALNTAAKAVLAFKQQSSPQAYQRMTASLKPVADMMLQVSGNTQTAKNSFIVWAQRLGIGRAEAGRLFNSLEHLNKSTNTAGHQAAVTNRQFDSLARQFGVSTSKANSLWNKISNQNLDFVGARAKASHDKFVLWAKQLGISNQAAEALWKRIARQNIDEWLGRHVGVSFNTFKRWGAQVDITRNQTGNLWRKIGEQKFDFLTGKADTNRASFLRLAAQFGITSNQAGILWNNFRHQELDTLGRKALTSAGAMNTLANGIANGTFAMQDLSRVWQSMQKVLGGPPVTVVSTLPGHQSFKLSQGGVNSPHASGGRVPGFAPGSDTVNARLSPGEFVVNPTSAKAFGYDKLAAINSLKPGSHPTTTIRNGMQEFVNGGQVVSYASTWAGHPYRWGGGANPQTGWDCSSFMNFVLGHFGFSDPNGGKAPSSSHGAVAADYGKFPHESWNTGKIGDIAVEKSGGHVGMLAANASGNSPIRGFAAIGHAFGTNFQTFDPGSFYLVKPPYAPGGTFTGGAGGGPGGPGGFSPAQTKQIKSALAETQKLENAFKISGGGLARPMMASVAQGVDKSATSIHNRIQSAYSAKLAAFAAAGMAGLGGNPSVAGGNFTGGVTSNGQPFGILPGNLLKAAQFFAQHGYSKAAAAGIAGNMAIESGGDPEQREFGHPGNGGLIGFTPLGKSGAQITGNVIADFNNQLGATLNYNNAIGAGSIRALNAQPTPSAAALYYETNFERPASVSASAALREAWAGQVFAHLANGGQVPGFAPGSDTVPALLSPGEFVINPVAAKAVGYDTLHALNAQKFAQGGKVSPLQSFEKSVAQMTQAGRLSKLKSLVSLTNTEHNHLANFKPHSASWDSLEHLISLHNQEIAFLEKSGTHLPSPPSAPKPKARVFPPGPVGAFERKIASLDALIKSWQARAASDQKSFNAAGFVDAENHIGSLTAARSQEQHRLSEFQAKQAAKKITPKMRAAARHQAAFNASVAAIRLTATLKSPQQKAAYYSSPYFGRLGDDLMNHSTRPYGIGGASSAAIHGLALGASPDLLNAIYAGDWGGVSTLLRTSDSKQFGVFKSLANTKKKRLATGGVITGKAIGFDVKTGTPFTLGESGRERVMPEHAMNRYEQDKPMTAAQAERLISAVTQLARATQTGNENTVSALTGIGKGVHRTR